MTTAAVEDLRVWLPWGIIACSIAVGAVVELVMLPLLFKRLPGRTTPLFTRGVLALRGVVLLWSIIAGIDIALSFFHINAHAELFLRRSLAAILILSVTLVVARVVVAFVEHWVLTAAHTRQSLTLFSNLAAVVVYALGLLIMLQWVGLSITPLLTAFGAAGLAVALALQDTLSNFFAGIHIIVSRRLRPGDYIRLQSGVKGSVLDVTWRNTLVRDDSNSIVVVPNAQVAQTFFMNYDQPSRPYEFEVAFKVAYDNDLAAVEREVLEIARGVIAEVPQADPDKPPVVYFRAFDDAGIAAGVVLGSRSFEEYEPVMHEMIKRIHNRFGAAGADGVYPFHAAGDGRPAAAPQAPRAGG